MDYEKLGLMMGLEIHQQLNTTKKLFCPCECELTDKKPDYHVLRYLRPTQSELGKIDRAAFEESRRELTFCYDAYPHHTCLVETDDEPPHPLNQEALEIGLIIATLLNMTVVDEFHTMRKQVIDGSNTGGFQRTGLLAIQGHIDTPYGKVVIENLGLEEDAARRMGQRKGKVEFRLDRLGIPLLEITTDPSMNRPEQVREVAYQIGQVLRSTRVKRGLGTIRQDLNISIREGARVEVKGVQDLDSMEQLVKNEVTRQLKLLEIMDELKKREAQVEDTIHDLGETLKDTESKIIAKALKKDGKVLAIKLNGYKGLIGKEVQPGRRFGTELAGYAKKMGVAGIFHTDELPAYGITSHEVELINGFLKIGENDAFILVADEGDKARNALEEVQRRAIMALDGVPEETRKALDDANTEYLRPLPTASRMYVETDIPTQVVSRELLEYVQANLPELPKEKEARIIKEYNLSEDLAHQLVRQDRTEQFEEIVAECGVEPTTVASLLAYTLKELRREGLDVEDLSDSLKGTFQLLKQGKISKDAVSDVLVGVLKENWTPEEAAGNLNLLMLSEENVRDIIVEIVSSNEKLITERKMGAMGSLMGMAMKELKGKADGKLVNKFLKEEIQKYL
ncbi:Glu-tRNA(Gln) amidotransferase subunit GatE [Methanobacterium formicicum]|uniref:Glutamyl-tRNA(Gln) amidotransferase subunit E n=1 Tax=Methanobacterium formicicum (strain DSM 3637 / PP1) TaxID=1204725 RepID=K2R0P0_METFP|nr:Glu-tRNA(Gln) amidotransferase subunit GatE [Methanobacterium formicicum]EKF86108.1 glutamyl-tRNA(Gln) amidotransferase subunit E [Methanobacterium formicicum DSM 3637]